jgi:PAS domain S-box-containing protein
MPDRFRSLSTQQRYLAALALVAIATAVRWSLNPLLGHSYFYLLQFLCVLVAARYFGFGPAITSLILGSSPILLRIVFIPRPPARSGPRYWISIGVVYCLSALLVWILDRQRRMRGEVETTTRIAGERLEQLTIEMAQREREQRFSAQLHAIVESSDDAIVSKDLDSLIRSWNYGAEQIYGYTAAEVVGQNIDILVPLDRLHEESDMIQRITHGGRVKHFETIRLRKSGEPIHVSLSISPIRDPRGNIVGVSHISRDITERKQLEEQIRQTQKLESLGVLAGGLAHDFNNLLTGIMGNASLALEALPEDNPTREHVAEVVAAGERAAMLIRQMLAYAGKGRFVVSRLDLSQQIKEIISLIGTSMSRNVRLDLQLADSLPEIEADAAQIQQIIMNLAINGVEAIGEDSGTVTIATFARETDAEHQVVLQVRDTGCGMDEATRARIFDPFFTTKFTGRGLGLSAVLGIIRGHHGFISVESTPSHGTTFTVVLPAATSRDASVAETVNGLRGYGHLLVVEDEEVIRGMTCFALERSGYTVEAVADGATALERFAARPGKFDAVLLDLTISVTDGEETLARLQAIQPDVCVVLSSGFSQSEATERFAGRRVAGFLQKPYTAALLARKVKQALRGQAAHL